MADFVNPTPGFAPLPDFLGSYLRGQMAPGQLQQQQQQLASGQQGLQAGALNLQQLQQAMKFTQFKNQILTNALSGNGQAAGGTLGAGAQSGSNPPAGGIQNGPQGSVSSQDAPNQNRPVQANGTQPNGVGGWSALGYNAPYSNITPTNQDAIALLAPELSKAMEERQKSALQSAQIQSQSPNSPLSALQSLASDPNADRSLMNNAQLLQGWPAVAKQFGFDPLQINATNVRRVATLAANAQRQAISLPPLPMPEHFNNSQGPYGQQLQTDDQTGKVSQVAGRELPSFSQIKTYNPKTGKEDTTLQQTGGLDAQGRPLSGGAPVSSTFDKPTPDNIKQASFAASMNNGVSSMRNLEQKGVSLSPTQRAQLIDVATNEEPGAIHAWLSQEALKHGLSKDQQAYVAAMFPVIQAVSHDQAGARVTTSQLRLNLESIIPVDLQNKQALATINNTRDAFQKATNVGAGSAAFTPEFNQSVGASRRGAAAGDVAPQSAITYLKAHPETSDHFKQKYGYLP